MKKIIAFVAGGLMMILTACNTATSTSETESSSEEASAGQANVQDDVSMKDVVKIAVASKDHSTLVAALKQADLVDVLANPGPFTVFAPTNAAFEKLPEGTVDGLMKDDKKAELQDILEYHVTTSSFKAESFTDGQVLGMVNGKNITITVKDGKVILNGSATVIASVQGSNGMVHVVDGVLLPPAKN
jgi:uncharacterized surface protein with fasciclin (FAS1) repeats